jgi:hypothetical protein
LGLPHFLASKDIPASFYTLPGLSIDLRRALAPFGGNSMYKPRSAHLFMLNCHCSRHSQ